MASWSFPNWSPLPTTCGGLCWSWKGSKQDTVATSPLMDVSVAATRIVALEVYAASAQDSRPQISRLKEL